MNFKSFSKTPYLVLFMILISIGVGTASALVTITLAGNVIITDDLTVDTDTLFVNSGTNKVGIGTTNPDAKLEIHEFTDTSASSTGTTLQSMVNDVGVDLKQQKIFVDFSLKDDNDDFENFTPQVRIGAEVGGNDGNADTVIEEGGGSFVVYTANGIDTTTSDLTEKLRVNKDGNVGIGTSAPTSKLHVIGNVTVDGTISGTLNSLATYNVIGTSLSSSDTVESVSCDPGDKVMTHSMEIIGSSAQILLQRSQLKIVGDVESWEFRVSDAQTGTVFVFISCLDLPPLRP